MRERDSSVEDLRLWSRRWGGRLRGRLFDQRFKGNEQFWQTFFDRDPKHLEINVELTVNQAISHADNSFPGDGGMSLFEFRRQFC